MFRVIQSFVDPVVGPEYLIMCDNRTCAYTAKGPAKLETATTIKESQQSFVSVATRDGWLIGLDAQLCPGHADQQRKADAMERADREKANGSSNPSLVSPNLQQIKTLGKGRPS